MQVASVAPGRSAVLSLCRTFVGRPTLSKTSERLVRCQASQCRSASTGQTPETSFVVLERAVAARAGVDRELWQSGRFNAEVYPDLPIAGSWAEFFAKIASRRPEQSDVDVERDRVPGRLLVRTVACQVRTRAYLKRRLKQVAQEGADSVLCLGGSHPAHGLAAATGWTPSSFELLQTAAKMRQDGKLPSALDLWAVENPLINPADRLEQKLEAGATVILTQPPLLWDSFASWWSDIHRKGLTQQSRVVVGIPMLTSTGNLRFWLHLCKAASNDGAAQLVQEFQGREGDKAEMARFTHAYNQSLIDRVLALPGIGGLHIMPLTGGARKQVLQLQQGGTIPQPV